MTMQRSLWSVNAIAVELGIDRRTVAKRLDGIPPAGTLRGSPAWRLAEVLDVVRGRPGAARAPAPSAPPPGCEAVAGLKPIDAVALLLLSLAARKAGPLGAALAVQAGLASPSAGPALELQIVGAVVHAAEEALTGAGLPTGVLAKLVAAAGVEPAHFDRIEGFDPVEAERLVAGLLA